MPKPELSCLWGPLPIGAGMLGSVAVHVGLGLRKSATRGETMPVAKRLNAWYVRRMCVAGALARRVPSPNPSPTLAEA